MSTQEKIDALHSQCRAVLRASNQTRSDYSVALHYANEAYDLAKKAALDPQVIAICERYQELFRDLINKNPTSIGRHNHDVYHTSAPPPRKQPEPVEYRQNQLVQEVERCEADVRVVPALITTSEGGVLTQRGEDGSGRGRTVDSSQSLVWMRDEHGNIVPPRRLPVLRAKRGQSFEGWKNMI